MHYKVLYTLKAKDDLVGMTKKDAAKIIRKIDFYINSGAPLKFAKKLTDFALGTYRFRVGDYRVIFDIDNKGTVSILLVLKIGHRKDVYL